MLAMFGCSKPTYPPAVLSQRLATADRVVVTNSLPPFGSIVTGDEVGRLAKAIASAPQVKCPAGAVFNWDVKFYAGTNFVSEVHLQGGGFLLEDGEYSDDTGVLNTFYEKLLREQRLAGEAVR